RPTDDLSPRFGRRRGSSELEIDQPASRSVASRRACRSSRQLPWCRFAAERRLKIAWHLIAELLLGAVDRLADGLDGELRPVGTAASGVEGLAVHGVGLGAEVGEGLVAAADGALVAEGVDVDGSDDDLLAWPRIGLGEEPPLEVDDHAAARPGEWRVV